MSLRLRAAPPGQSKSASSAGVAVGVAAAAGAVWFWRVFVCCGDSLWFVVWSCDCWQRGCRSGVGLMFGVNDAERAAARRFYENRS